MIVSYYIVFFLHPVMQGNQLSSKDYDYTVVYLFKEVMMVNKSIINDKTLFTYFY